MGTIPTTAAWRGREVGEWLEEYRPRLERTLRARLDPRLRRRVDPNDVVQECNLEVLRRFAEFERDAEVELFVWVRFLALQELARVHRRHLGAQARDAAREAHSAASMSGGLADRLTARGPSPSALARGDERRRAVEQALGTLSDTDREVLLLRHFEALSNRETAQVLEIEERAASMRHLRALASLRDALGRLGLSTSDLER